jgi:phosphatidylserine synthase
MVSPIPYHSGKNLRLSGYRALVVSVFALGLVLAKPDVTLFLIGIVYVASGPIGWLMRKRSGRELEELAEESGADGGAERTVESPG